MRLSEIDKATFQRKLADPAAQELIDIANLLSEKLYPMRFRTDGEDKESAMIRCIAPWGDEDEYTGHLEGFNFVLAIQRLISESDHWVWDTSEGDADDVLYCYVIRKT